MVATIAGTATVDGETDTLAPDIEGLVGGTGDDVLTGDDTANALRGGPGADTLDGRGGIDALRGDSGADTLLSSGDGATDANDCGADTDTAKADPADTLTDCEQVEVVTPAGGAGDGGTGGGGVQGGAGGVPIGGAGPGQAGPLAGPKVAIAKRTVKVGRNQIATVRLTCPRTAPAVCAGTLALNRGKKRLGTRAFTIAPGRSIALKVNVKRARRSLARSRKGLRVRAIALTQAPGLPDATTKRTLLLKRSR